MTDTPTCTSAICSRLCYTVLDLACQYHKVTLEAGKHVPLDIETEPKARIVEDW